MKSVVPKKAAALLLVCAAGLAFFIFETVQTVRANAEAQLMEEWGLETALTSSDAEAEPRKVICLTFDDGPSYLTPKVLEILKQYGVRATFLSPVSIRNMHTVLKRRGMQGIQWECIRILMIMRRSMLPQRRITRIWRKFRCSVWSRSATFRGTYAFPAEAPIPRL
ncbi:MAG: polysaccharide deacetylase family protein [Anaerovoracaceae bacterium]